MKNQLKILKGTIGHMDNLKKTLNYNENLLLNETERIGLARSLVWPATLIRFAYE